MTLRVPKPTNVRAGALSSIRMFQVDAFATKVFAGNPAAVLLLDHWLADDMMLAIAQENNLAETAFARTRNDGSWDLRWFTPICEVDFCGHATLATAHVLLTETDSSAPITFHTRVGPLHVSGAPRGYRLDIPCLPPEPLTALPREIEGLFSAPPAQIFRNFENIFADLGSAAAVREFIPDLVHIARLGRVGLVVTGREVDRTDVDFVSRYFAPGVGIPEDPVTGSIHATLVPYWAERMRRKHLTAFQASARGGMLHCELAGDRVYLVGAAATFMDAVIFLPGYDKS